MENKIGDFFRRFTPALVLAGTIVATAPIMGQLRDFFFAAFPGRALRTIGISLGVLVAALFLLALWRIREHRLLRYGGLVVVFGLLWLQVIGFSRGVAQVDVVERIHVLEYGSIAALVYWGMKRRKEAHSWPELAFLPIFAATLAGVLDEGAQRVFQLRVADFRDVMLNAFAALVGVLFAALLSPPKALAPTRPGLPRVIRAFAATLAGLGLFVLVAHLGHDVRDDNIGRFRSYYTAEGLADASRDRAERWAKKPPTGLEPWAFKDLYLEEASRHATHRNQSLEIGQVGLALRANDILEHYYSPFLDIEGYRGSGRHRWSKEMVAELRAKTPPIPAYKYESPVLRDHIMLGSKWSFLFALFWACYLLHLFARRLELKAG